MRVLAKRLGAQKGDTVYWYETLSESFHDNSNIKPENINLDK
jgi:hypothetical protein